MSFVNYLSNVLHPVLVILSVSCLISSSDPLDITLYSRTPLTTSSSWFRGYALNEDRDIRNLSIGILYKNIDGKDNVTWNDTDDVTNRQPQNKDMPDGKIFPTSSSITYRVFRTHTYLGVAGLSAQTEKVGVFSFEAKKNEVVTNSAIVLSSASANIAMEYRTMTVGIGEFVTINLSKGGDLNDLRWRHNYGEEIHNLRGNTSAVIENIRRKDDGIYECYTGDRPEGNHGIMRLIVRACPSPKWNTSGCEQDCPVCYNGGVCDDKTGVCICPAGFKGDACQNGCGTNNWGRDCLNVCATGGNCRGALFCPPDPVGCACIDGFGGRYCEAVCEDGYYGGDCRQKCNCENCTQETGCTSGSTCLSGYTGYMCLEPVSCLSGFFGVLCNFPCHCKDSEDCNRDGSCTNGCHEAWAGSKCSIALPYRTEPPSAINQTATTLTFDVTWIPGEDYGTGIVTKRKLSYKSSEMDSFISITEPDNDLFLVVDNLTPNTKYQFYSQFSRMVGGVEVDGPRSTIGTTNTICSEPLEIPGLELKANEETHIILSLKPVSSDYDRIQCNYILRYQVQYSEIDGNLTDVVNTTSSSQLEVELLALSSCTAYVVNARVVNNMEIAGNWGDDVVVQTAPSVPSVKSNSFVNGTYLLIKWNASTCDIPGYQVTYHYELSGGIFQQGTTTQTEVVFGEGIKSCKEYTFTVLASYSNVNGTSNTKKFMSGTNCDTSDDSNSNLGYIIVLACGSLIAIVIAVAIIFMIFKRFRRTNSKKESSSSTSQQDVCALVLETDYQTLSKKYEQNEYEGVQENVENSADEPIYTDPDLALQQEPGPVYNNTELDNEEYKPIELSKLHDYVRKRQLSVENGFEKEFKVSQQELDDNKSFYSCKVAESLGNRKKNQNPNVIPYDNSRVVLDLLDDVPGSDYINASYVDGCYAPREFIACQGPTFDSINDMWRMIWKEKSMLIVIVTNLTEAKKQLCEKYWPDLSYSKEFGKLLVTNAEETDYGYYVFRKLKVQKVGENDRIHNVYQYHFTEWPEKSVPSKVPHLIDFIKKFRKTQLSYGTESGPVIVHCSSGAGRSGTMIAIAAMLDMSDKEGKVDVFNFVRSMRQKRIKTVQTKEQYTFIYAVLLEEWFCGQTMIPVDDIQKIIQKQKLKTSSDFEYQLKTLNSLFPHHVDGLTSQSSRPDGNKCQDVLFLTKGCFSSEVDSDGDYVNASFIEHCNKEDHAYIVTRTPLADDNSVDFWRMVFDYKSDVIVQLNEMDDLTSAVYLPNKINQKQTVGKFTVTIKSTHQYDFLTKKKINLEKDNSKRRIVLYEVNQWPKNEPVPEVDSFVKFVMTIMQRDGTSPITVHCRDGVVRSGLFWLVYSVIQKMREEKVVDVFQTLKALRSACPTAVDSEVQYNFCYDTALCYLKTYEE